MKHNKQNQYAFFKAKVLFFGLGMILLACIGTGVVYSRIWQGQGGDWVVTILHDVFMLSWSKAHQIYQTVFRNHASAMWFYCAIAIFCVTFGFFLRWITGCFRKIENGIDSLMTDKGDTVSLPPEFSTLEGKLNAVRQKMEKRTLEAKLAEQRKNDLVMYLAHDIRTPLTSVIGYLNLLDDAPDMPAELRTKYTHITLEKATRLESLVNEFFEITRFNLQQIPVQEEKIDLYYMLLQLSEEFYPILSQKKNALTLEASEDLTVTADSEKLARVFNNVLKNAASYADPGTEIRIHAEKMGQMVQIIIENHGPAIPREKLNAIFDRFYRIDDARSTGNGGAGLGLAIAKEIVTLHGGTIQAESQEGLTSFTITLPQERMVS